MKKLYKYLFAITLSFIMIFANTGQLMASSEMTPFDGVCQLVMTPHMSRYGWDRQFEGGITYNSNEYFGSVGRNIPMEAFRINVCRADVQRYIGEIWADVHVRNIGWMGGKRVDNGDGIRREVGTTGQGLPIEAVVFESTNKKLQYRVHLQNYGWTSWTTEGRVAGTTGQSRNLEAIQLRII